MEDNERVPYILGLDIGSNSVGWAIIELDARNTPCRLIDANSRVFEEASKVDKKGKEKTPNAERRAARLIRRTIRRRGAAQRDMFKILQAGGLLPDSVKSNKGKIETTRGPLLCALNSVLVHKWQAKLCPNGEPKSEMRRIAQVLPYVIRARAVTERLDLVEVGRAIYHLGQRRGFKSNRKSTPKPDEKPGEVSESIESLKHKMGQQTLGQYLATLNPEETRIRGKGQYASRKMYEDEFEAIWRKQAEFHPLLANKKLKGRIRRAIFHQEPIKSQRNRIGRCELIKDARRASMAALCSQMFRLQAKVNNFEYVFRGEKRTLLPEERTAIITYLQDKEEATYAALRKMLKWPRGARFNVEGTDDEEADVRGNTTAARLIQVFGAEEWSGFSEMAREKIVRELIDMSNEAALARRGKKRWGLNDEQQARKYGAVKLERGYMHYSRRAMERLLPLLKDGMRENEAIARAFDRKPPEPMDHLPPVAKVLPNMTNPLVKRALSEVRHIVNHLLRRYGTKPALVRIELLRELKKPKEERERIWKQNKANERSGKDAVKLLLDEAKIKEPTGSQIEKAKLYIECGHHCPYTSLGIRPKDLFSEPPRVEVDHIIPFSRSLDNSFMNKTLCLAEVNQKKGNRTPFEAFGPHVPNENRGNIRPWNDLLAAVRCFPGDAGRVKLERFQMESMESIEDFAERQFNDAAYASKEAKRYIGLLYGGEAASRVSTGKGRLTSILRSHWGLRKSRDDHRHHAVDAIVTAMLSRGWVKEITDACLRAQRRGRSDIDRLPLPWASFRDDVIHTVEKAVVSHRVVRKINGPLHEDTYYEQPAKTESGKTITHVRKPLSRISAKEVNSIVDPRVRALVVQRMNDLGQADPGKAFALPENHPFFVSRRNHRQIPIHSVRIAVKGKPCRLGTSEPAKYVKTGDNHHLEVFEISTAQSPKWEGRIVTRLEAIARATAKPKRVVIDRTHPSGGRFLFSLAQGESVRMTHDGEGEGIFRVTVISRDERGHISVELRRNEDAIPDTRARKMQDVRIRKTPGSLQKCGAVKVMITPLGEVRRAND